MVSPFAKVKDLQKGMRRRTKRGTPYDVYTVTLEAVEMEQLSPETREELLQRVTADTPRMYELIMKLVRDNDTREDIEFDIERLKRGITDCKRECSQHEKALMELNVLDEERKLIDLMGLWRETLYTTGGLHGDNKSLGDLEHRLREYGIEATEYNEDLERQLASLVNGTITGLEMFWSEGNREENQKINSNFSRLKVDTGFSREEIVDEISASVINFSLNNSEADVDRMINLLSRSCSYFEEHMSFCGIDGRDDLEYKKERTERRVNSAYEDIHFLNEEIAKKRKELDAHNVEMEAIKPEIRNWKSNIARICMSDCRTVELQLEEQIKAVEMQKEAEKVAKEAAEEAKRKIALEQAEQVKQEHDVEPSIEFTTEVQEKVSPVQNDLKTQIKREHVEFLGQVLEARFEPQHMTFNQNARLSFDTVARQCERLAIDIQNISGTRYSSRLVDYKIAMRNAKNSVNKAVELGQSDDGRDSVVTLLEQVGASRVGIADDRVANEVLTIRTMEENLLKKVVFEKFCNVAINAEVASLSAEAKGIRAADSKKGLSRLFGGPSKKDIERCEQIESIVEAATQKVNKPFMQKTYSYREIMADMDFFKEQHRGDERYFGAIAEVERLQGTLNTHFSVANASSILGRKEQKMQEQAASGMDPRVHRIRHLKNEMEQNGIIYRAIPNAGLSDLQKVSRYMNDRTREIERNQRGHLHKDGSEIS